MKILVFRLSAIGDIILTSAFIRCLKEQIPNCTVDFVVKKQFKQLVSENPHISNCYTVDSKEGVSGLRSLAKTLKNEKYDLLFDIHKNFRSRYVRNAIGVQKVYTYKKHVFKRALLTSFKIDLYNPPRPVYKRFIDSAKSLGIEDDNKGTEFFINNDIQTSINEKLQKLGVKNNNFIALCPGASFWNKQWPIEHFKQLASLIIQHSDKRIVIIGGPKEKNLAKEIAQVDKSIINLTGQLNLQESAAVLNNTLCTVVNDTGMLHLSEALKKPVVGLYGPTSKQLGYFPILKESIVMENNSLACRPCTKMGTNGCPKKHFKCMLEITPESVYKAIQTYM